MGGDDFHKGVKAPTHELNASGLKILIVHTRWNSEIVDPLVAGARTTLESMGVASHNIVVRDVPGAFELPGAAQKLIRQSQQQTNLVSSVIDDLLSAPGTHSNPETQGPFDAAICIGVLIKGSTLHFEYISDAVSHGIMRVGLDTGVPTVFGVLTCLTDDQAMERAGIGRGANKGHNHGVDWATAAVEMACLKL
ncbi:lumazine synthase [Coemansia sp. RSA 2523]|nr:lumazine synthase [Coemansia sp. RSA 1591]KAJ1762553.1 lumazine synthase [Coemansia sp. RSA 1752]KAJ1777934.1 lumazine synthase [Coemansia sp. RSA 1824]KAJ1779468.1 lumazine synthase [Coemansia sp. RSA 1938]KAJ1792731.1 lumazine synthase [Coemansia sp. RSA 2167]KAJ1808204.1 lumazine synthase [Coemansia sp. RSA 2523]KAJ2111257.1 lumazine synthase [Coemansia sp. RSA 788]KAJ2133001.1 lumazine synthase [Coemansia sp. RSA 921]KAJ2148698.1 lumazine synthase [Coemansia sp. RSA 564]KAJ2154590.1